MSGPQTGGAIADAMTLLRLALVPVIMGLILWRWPETQVAILVSVLFIIAAITDLLDDWFGGSSVSHLRKFGPLDDAADTLLITGVLIALSIVLWRNGLFAWPFAVPAIILIVREVLIGLLRGKALREQGWPDNFVSNAKGGLAMLGIALLVASPWLSPWIDNIRATPETVVSIYNGGSPYIWMIGQVTLWLAAIFSMMSGFQIMRGLKSEVKEPS